MGEHKIKWRSNTLLDFDYAYDLIILNESVNNMYGLLEVLRVRGVRIGSKSDVKKTKSLNKE